MRSSIRRESQSSRMAMRERAPRDSQSRCRLRAGDGLVVASAAPLLPPPAVTCCHSPVSSSAAMALLGIKMSVFCSLLSVWGILMLAAMGGLLMIKSVAFAEDFEAETLEEMYEKYDKAAGSCWIACGIYGATLLFSAHQWYLNVSN